MYLWNIPKYLCFGMNPCPERSVSLHYYLISRSCVFSCVIRTTESELEACLCFTPDVCMDFGTLLKYSSGLPQLCWRPPFPVSSSCLSLCLLTVPALLLVSTAMVRPVTVWIGLPTPSGMPTVPCQECTDWWGTDAHWVMFTWCSISPKQTRAWQSHWYTWMFYCVICSSWDKRLQSKCVCL